MRTLNKKLEKILKIEIKNSLIYLTVSILIIGCSPINRNSISNLIIKIQNIHRADSLEYGEVIYKSPILDTLNLSKEDKRFLWLHFGIYDKPKSINELQKQKTESYKAINDSVIPFESKYSKEGVYYFEGFIEETFLLHKYYDTGEMKKITTYIKVSKKIEVEKK